MPRLTIIAIALAIAGGAFLLSQSISDVRTAAEYESREREFQERMDSYILRQLALSKQVKATDGQIEELAARIAAMR